MPIGGDGQTGLEPADMSKQEQEVAPSTSDIPSIDENDGEIA